MPVITSSIDLKKFLLADKKNKRTKKKHTSPRNRVNHVENLEKVGLGCGGVKLFDIEGGWS